MNHKQLAYLKLAEECNEVAQLCSKIIMFSEESFDPTSKDQLSNRQLIHNELNDLQACIQVLNERFNLMYAPDNCKIQSKIQKMDYYASMANLG